MFSSWMSTSSVPPQCRSSHRRVLLSWLSLLAVVTTLLIQGSGSARAADPCAPPVTNKVACENTKPGDPPSDWQIDGAGDPTIQGFATQISVDVGQTEQFKIKTPASSYHINILRLGYYGGDGARIIASGIKPTASLPQSQPSCLKAQSTGLIDCGNWGVSASWTVPSDAVSGLYVAQLVRNDTGGESQILFVVREDESHADVVVKTSDATWEAYNNYGGNSLYSCTVSCPSGEPAGYAAAYAVSYNRPFDGTIERDGGQSDPFYAEYQMIRFLERNGYDVTYVAQPDVERDGALLRNHKAFISSAHDEYWSGPERANVEAAREAGVNLAFFSGNEVFWKTRWAPSIDGSNTPDRTLVTYKETHFSEPVDPEEPAVATPSWRDPRFAAGGAGRPENGLTGQLFLVNSGTADIKVPGTFAKLRFWRNTQVASLSPSQTLTLSPGTGTLGYEWDVDADNGFRPPGRIPLSSTTVNGLQTFRDYGTEVEEPTTASHSLSLYRAPSGALVFGAGTVQWSWGLDNTNAWNGSTTDPSENPPDPNMEQATVNLFADMGAQPATLQSGLVGATESTDTVPPTATVASPSPGQTFRNGEMVTVSGTATDGGGGVVAAVEVSTDGGKSWHPAGGTSSWTYSWNVEGANSTTIKARAVDDSANIGAPSAGTSVSVLCPCSLLGGATPKVADAGDPGSIELGVKFRSDVAGTVSGIRYFKSARNTGTHTGSLWSAGGELLAEATFSGESESGWQQVEFSSPVPIKANTTYVASYLAPHGHYADTSWQLNDPPALGSDILDRPPLHILPDVGTGNGVYQYTSTSAFPTGTYHADNYWVDVLFEPSEPPGRVTGVQATAGEGEAAVSWNAPSGGAPATSYRVTPYVEGVARTPRTVTGEPPATTTTVTGLTAGTTYTFVVTALNEAGAGPDSEPSNAVTPTAPQPPSAPTGVTATAGFGSATVSWTAPSSGGSPTSYRITPYLEGTAQTAKTISGEPPATTTTVSGLSAGASYTFVVSAANAVGTGPDSEPSAAVTPLPPQSPGAPTAVSATAKSSGALVSWSAPASDGGSPITGYRITPYKGTAAQTPTTTSSAAPSASVGGLEDGTAYTFKVAAVNAIGSGDDSAASAAITPRDTIFDLATPGTVDSGDGGSVELGVKFRSDVEGKVDGIRFYKSAANTGTHIGSLWSADGELLAEATFSGESASGWQQVEFSKPVPIEAETTYVAGYLAPNGHYSANGPSLATAVDNPPLHAEAGETSGGDGVYAYGSGVSFPTNTYLASNYWVDVLFTPPPPPQPPGAPTNVSATAGFGSATVSWSAPSSGDAPTSYRITPYLEGTAQTPKTTSGEPPATTTTVSGLTAGASYTFLVSAANEAGSSPDSEPSNAVTPGSELEPPGVPTGVTASARNQGAVVSWSAPESDGGSAITGYRITPYVGSTAQATTTVAGTETAATVDSLTNGTSYTVTVTALNAIGPGPDSTATTAVVPRETIFEQEAPATPDAGDTGSTVLGVKFSSAIAGEVRGVRFYKSAENKGTHVVGLWSEGGTLLAQATAAGETASGWQQVEFAGPVPIEANTTYVAGYLAPKGHYAATVQGLLGGAIAGPLTALANSTSPNGLYVYAKTLTFPISSYQASNYWVDVLFTP
jgi:fibronectin type 3 domain-containing protein